MADDIRSNPISMQRAPRGAGPVRFDWADVIVMSEAGLFAENERVELIDGEIAIMPEEGALHVLVLQHLKRWLLVSLPSTLELDVRGALRISEETYLIPDLCVLNAGFGPADCTVENADLIVEVAVSTLKNDLNLKCKRYAAAGALELWVVDANARRIWVHTNPSDDGFLLVQAFEIGAKISPTCAQGSAFEIASLPDPSHYQ
jgi:Uma2 family endonuclease